jgi:DNA-binding Lrp family transcriptional regulator
LFGEYDLIAKIEAGTFDEIGDIVVKSIRTMDGVKATKTLPRTSF